jgi:hypothetical protein
MGSVDGIVTRLQAERPAVQSLTEAGDFFFFSAFNLALGPEQPSVLWYWKFLPRTQAEAFVFDHLPTPEAESENEWGCSSVLTLSLHGFGMKDLLLQCHVSCLFVQFLVALQ